MAALATLRGPLAVLVIALLHVLAFGPRGAHAAPEVTVVDASVFYSLWKGPTSANITFLDVRAKSLYVLSHIPRARNIPSENAKTIAAKFGNKDLGVSTKKDIACYCTITQTAQTACGEFAKLKAYAKVRFWVLQNGISAWVAAKYPTESGEAKPDKGKGGKAGR